MFLTLVILILCTSMVVFFIEEIADFIGKLFAYPGVKLFLPLLLASCMVENFEPWVLWGLLWLQNMLFVLIHMISVALPFKRGALVIAEIAVMISIACLPTAVSYGIATYKKVYLLNNSLALLGTFLWLIASLLIVLAFPPI